MLQGQSGLVPSRLVALDGLRGITALSVIVFHFFWEVLGTRFPLYNGPLLAGLTNSNVGIFLAVSGYVLTEGNWRLRHKPRVERQLVKRYFRLTIPMLASVLIVFSIVSLGLAQHVGASRLLGIEEWLGVMLRVPGSLVDAVLNAAIYMYLPHPRTDDYNPFLWTVQAELWGSYLLFAILLLDQRVSPYFLLIGGALTFLLFNPISCAILLGALLSLLKHDGYLDGMLADLSSKPLVQGLYLASAFALGAHALPNGLQDSIAPVAALLVLLPVLASSGLQRLLSSGPMRFLGRLSFALLLVQFPVLITFTSGAMLWLAEMDSLNLLTATLVAVNSSLLCVLCACAFLPIEAVTRAFCSWLSRAVFGKAPASLALPMPS